MCYCAIKIRRLTQDVLDATERKHATQHHRTGARSGKTYHFFVGAALALVSDVSLDQHVNRRTLSFERSGYCIDMQTLIFQLHFTLRGSLPRPVDILRGRCGSTALLAAF